MKTLYSFILILLLGWVSSPTVRAQSADEILRKTAERYENALADIENMKMVLHPEGDFTAFDQMITYYKKTEDDSKAIFQTRTEFKGGIADMAGATSGRPIDLVSMSMRMHEKLRDKASYQGTETVDGVETYVLFVEDMTPLIEDVNDPSQQMPEDIAFSNARLYIDAREYVMRKMTMQMEMKEPGMMRTMQMEMTMSDYRQVGPLYYPFSMKTVMENPISDEQRAEMEQQRAQIEATLEQLPEAQREQMRKMLGAFGNDQIVIEMIMEELLVNEGVPEELFK